MYKGNISNKFAKTVVIDINLIYSIKKETLVDKVKSFVGVPKFKLINSDIPKMLERLFYKDYMIYIVDRNTETKAIRKEELIEDWCYTKYRHIEDVLDMQILIEQEHIVLAVFDNDYPTLKVAREKGETFTGWGNIMGRLI